MSPLGHYKYPTKDAVIEPVEFVTANWDLACQLAHLYRPILNISDDAVQVIPVGHSFFCGMYAFCTHRQNMEVTLNSHLLADSCISVMQQDLSPLIILWAAPAATLRDILVHQGHIPRDQLIGRYEAQLGGAREEYLDSILQTVKLDPKAPDYTQSLDACLIFHSVMCYVNTLDLEDEELNPDKLSSIIRAQKDEIYPGYLW